MDSARPTDLTARFESLDTLRDKLNAKTDEVQFSACSRLTFNWDPRRAIDAFLPLPRGALADDNNFGFEHSSLSYVFNGDNQGKLTLNVFEDSWDAVNSDTVVKSFGFTADLHCPSAALASISCNGAFTKVVTGSFDQKICIWDLASRSCISTLVLESETTTQNFVRCSVWSDGHSAIFAGSDDGLVRAIDIEKNQVIWANGDVLDRAVKNVLIPDASLGSEVTPSSALFVCCDSGEIKQFDPRDPQNPTVNNLLAFQILGLDALDSTTLIFSTGGGSIGLFDVRAGKIQTLRTEVATDWIRNVVFSPDRSKIFAADDKGNFIVLDTEKFRQESAGAVLVRENVNIATGFINQVKLCPYSASVATCGDDGTMFIASFPNGEFIKSSRKR